MGLFLKKSSQDLEILNDMYNTVNTGHIWPIVLKGLDKDLEILILVGFMVFSMELNWILHFHTFFNAFLKFGHSINPLRTIRFSKNRIFFEIFVIFRSAFLREFVTKNQKLYHHSIANFPLISKMGLFKKKAV